MADDDKTKNRESLYQLLNAVEKYAPEIERIAHNAISPARLARDVAASFRDFVGKIPQ